MNKVIDSIRTQAETAVIHNELMNSEIAKNAEQLKQIQADILQKWKALDLQQQGLDIQADKNTIDKFNAEVHAAYPTLGQSLRNTIMTTITTLQDAVGDKDKVPTKVPDLKHK